MQRQSQRRRLRQSESAMRERAARVAPTVDTRESTAGGNERTAAGTPPWANRTRRKNAPVMKRSARGLRRESARLSDGATGRRGGRVRSVSRDFSLCRRFEIKRKRRLGAMRIEMLIHGILFQKVIRLFDAFDFSNGL